MGLSCPGLRSSPERRRENTMKMTSRQLALPILLVLAGACDESALPPPAKKVASATTKAKLPTPTKPSRQEFNRRAVQLGLGLYWYQDKNSNGDTEADEIVALWGMHNPRQPGPFLRGGKFSPSYVVAKKAIWNYRSPVAGKDAQSKRRVAVAAELDQGRPTLVRNDFRNASAEDKAIVGSVLAAAKGIERLYQKQVGSWELRKQLDMLDTASQSLFYRNQGPWCVAPKTEKDPDCRALAKAVPKVSGLYPAKLQANDSFCDALKKHKDQAKLLHQFHVVTEKDGELRAVPYHKAYATEMGQIATYLEAAAAAIKSESEAAFKSYLEAAAKAFRDDSWPDADEAWAKMNATNSKWYLRIGPDEVYFEPCNRKAGFHVSFAKINQDSLVWQKKLDPVKGQMEEALAELAGKPYKARKVNFDLPDFIDIVLNAGDSRNPHGATIGQSLPNWGPVANEGRGRTVAMTNLYTDDDSRKELTKQASSLLCAATMKNFVSEPEPQVLNTVLHEAAHNLGPAHEYKVDGKKAPEIFGGPLASTMEELKAQTAALYFTDWLVDKKILSAEQANRSHVRNLTWAFGHISRGMYTANKRPRSYSQLAAIQLGFLMEKGALRWDAKAKAANGSDLGCFELVLPSMPTANKELMKVVASIKGSGNKAGAQELKAKYVDATGTVSEAHKVIRERWLRAPKATFVYAIQR
jgi:hypothetical protein